MGFTEKNILIKLCEKDKTPTAEIFDFLKDRFGIRETKNIRIHLGKLEKQKLIRKDSPGPGHAHSWFIISDSRVLKDVVDRLDHDQDIHAFMRSLVYRRWVPEIANQFAKSFADLKLSMCDINWYNANPKHITLYEKTRATVFDLLKRHGYTEYYEDALKSDEEFRKPTVFTDAEIKEISDALTFNWSMLRFVLYYLAADDAIKRELMIRVIHDAELCDDRLAIKATMLDIIQSINQTYHQKYNDQLRGEVLCMQCDVVEKTLATDGEKPRMWFVSLFDRIENMRNRYPFLFD